MLSQSLGLGWTMKFKAKNLLDSPSILRIPAWEGGALEVQRVNLGLAFSLGVTKKW